MRKKTHEEYVEELKVKNPTVEVVGKYIDAKTKIMYHCLIHDIYWNTSPSSVLQGCGCEECKKDKLFNANYKTHEDYVKELMTKNPTVEAVDKYIDARAKILHHCLIHDVYWMMSPDNALKGTGCQECKKEKFRNKVGFSHEQYVSMVREVNPNIIVIGKYVNIDTPILHKCITHNITWMAYPTSILNGGGCKECKIEKIGNKNRKPVERYIDELKKM